MQVVSIISTKGGVGKTTTAANLGGFIADAGLRVLLLDLDVQPTLSSHFTLDVRAPGGIYEMLAFNERRIEQLVSRTAIAGLDLVLSNDDRGELNTLLLHAPDGRLRLRHLLPVFRTHYDLLLIDTRAARSVLLEMAVLGVRSGAVAGDAGNPRGARTAARHAATDRGHRAVSAPGHRTAAAAPAHQPCIRCRRTRGWSSRRCDRCSRNRPACRCWTPTCRPSKPIRALRHEDCRCIGWSTGGRLGARRPRRWTPCARWPASCSRVAGRFALVTGRADAGGPAMASAHELARGRERLRALIEFALARRLARGAHVRRAPEIHETRLRVDLHQPDCERPPCRPQCPRALRRADRQAQENGRG